MDLGEQSDMNPNPSFRADSQPQFQSQYSYPQSTSAFAIDQDMNMSAENFAASVQAHANAPLDAAANDPNPGQNVNSLSTSPVGMSAPGMAPPPQSSSQSYSPRGTRPSIDDGQDVGLSGADPKRKRSKVSRACDECRRKKVRCDAAADDGTIKTCSNCARAGLTCEYSRIPMKRGPSKGYIKELSERVQQVESLQMALSNTPGYRQSLDGTATGMYAEQPYSPDDPMSLKRNFSFSADQRSPFGGAEYNRDRMPSLGGWNTGSPHASMFRARDRGSIAVAPDQQPTGSVSFSKPFWMQEIEGPSPAKHQRLDSDEMQGISFDQEMLSQYYRDFHTHLPVLPEPDSAMGIIVKATPKIQHAFLAAVRTLSAHSSRLQNGDESNTDGPIGNTSVFESRDDLQMFMWNSTRDSPARRSNEDNLLYLWTYLLMAVEAENDLSRLHDGILPRTVIIKQAVDLGWSCVTAGNRVSAFSGSHTDTKDATCLDHFARAWHCATVLARLHALAVGSGNPIPLYTQQKGVPLLAQVLPPTAVIVTLAAGLLTTVSLVVQDPLPPSQLGRNLDMRHRIVIQEQFDWGVAGRSEAAGNEALVEHLQLLLDLLLSRYTLNFNPLDIIIPAVALADLLGKHNRASVGHGVYNPFTLHLFTLTTITLLEFMQEGNDTDMYKMANGAINTLKRALEYTLERNHAQNDVQDKDGTNPDSTPARRKPVHWADALLKMIDERLKIDPVTVTNEVENGGDHGVRNIGEGSNAVLDFSLLLRYGYLNVLMQQAN